MKDLCVRVVFLGFVLLIIPLMFVRFEQEKKYDDTNAILIKLYDNKIDSISEIELEEYIIGVLAAEMPATFHKEALKTQAVCARTYALRKINKNLSEHKGGDVCTDFAHCQAYLNYDEMKEKWGKDYEKNLEKIKLSVFETRGEVVTYKDEYAISVFHSCSNGKTENASDVWGGTYPYLVSVDSVGDFEKSDYSTYLSISKDEFINKINTITQNTISSDDKLYIGDFKMTSGDNVQSVMIGTSSISGTEIRKLFSLKSTAFTIEEKDDMIVFSVYGNGHGVGMSQYGANAMAKKGVGYKEILKHYYQGVEIQSEYNLK